MVSFSAGEFAGSIASGRVRLRRPLLTAALGLVLMALPPLLLASGAGVGALCVAEFGAGIGIAAYPPSSSRSKLEHSRSPDVSQWPRPYPPKRVQKS